MSVLSIVLGYVIAFLCSMRAAHALSVHRLSTQACACLVVRCMHACTKGMSAIRSHINTCTVFRMWPCSGLLNSLAVENGSHVRACSTCRQYVLDLQRKS